MCQKLLFQNEVIYITGLVMDLRRDKDFSQKEEHFMAYKLCTVKYFDEKCLLEQFISICIFSKQTKILHMLYCQDKITNRCILKHSRNFWELLDKENSQRMLASIGFFQHWCHLHVASFCPNNRANLYPPRQCTHEFQFGQ